jgi:hypothetical protein
MTSSDSFRLADIALAKEKKTSFFIEKQFPAIYREEGRELIELVKAYYRFLEENEAQSTYNIRRIYEYRNLDTTLESMLIFFKNKFMNGLFFDKDIRFVVKHILDLYRRKGSTEGIELFFKLFFDSEASIYYPSEDMFKPSTSLWKTGSFIQLYGVTDTKIFGDIVDKKIFGDKSKSEAFVDSIYFLNIDNYTIPVLFLSGIKGKFTGYDVIFSDNPVKIYGRVYGSVRQVIPVQSEFFSANNAIGDIVEIVSPTGFGAKGRVTKVSQVLSGQIDFQIVNGGFGYTDANTTVQLSSQTAFFTKGQNIEPVRFVIGERVSQVNSENVEVIGQVIGQKIIVGSNGSDTSTGFYLTPGPDDDANTYFLEGGFPIETIDRTENISEFPAFVTEQNDTAKAGVSAGSVADTESITIITDLIENYLNVTLDSPNYSTDSEALLEMSGTRVNDVVPTLSTQLNEAFVPEDFEIGRISKLSGINPGLGYFADAFVLARENIISRFNLRNQVLRIVQSPGVVLFVGDIITQEKTIKTFEGTDIDITVRGRVVNTIGNEIYVTQLTFESFVTTSPIFKQGSTTPITAVSRSRDQNSRPLGLNADISANVETVVGRIEAIDVIDSGFGYGDKSIAQVFNTTKSEREGSSSTTPDCLVTVNARDQGIAEGRWESFFSHINQEKVIQDSLFYQDYSYQVTTDVSSTEYINEYIDTVHPVGMKLFTAFGKTDSIIFSPEVLSVEISSYKIDDTSQELLSETNSSIIIENGFAYININFNNIPLLTVE